MAPTIRQGRPVGAAALSALFAVILTGCMLCALAPSRAYAQPGAGPDDGMRERLGIDRLRLTSIGVTGGVVKPAQVEPTELVSLHADYGEVLPRWRLVFSATYWNSRYTDATVQQFADSLQTLVEDPTGDARVVLGPIRVSVLSITAEGRWNMRASRQRVRPYIGVGMGGYAVNAEGRGLSGTFVESALDNIATGMAFFTGGDILILPNLTLDMQARYDVLSGTRFGSLRTGASYIFRSRGDR